MYSKKGGDGKKFLEKRREQALARKIKTANKVWRKSGAKGSVGKRSGIERGEDDDARRASGEAMRSVRSMVDVPVA